MTSTTRNTWEPKLAADRLAEHLADLLDYVGRVDQAVTTGDLHYLADKARGVIRAATNLQELARELIDDSANVHPHLPAIEAYLARAGQMGYRVTAALHPSRSGTTA
jgi:hypothetical protein